MPWVYDNRDDGRIMLGISILALLNGLIMMLIGIDEGMSRVVQAGSVITYGAFFLFLYAIFVRGI